MALAVLTRSDLDFVVDPAPGPVDRLLAAEAAYLAIPPRRRPSGWSTALLGLNLVWDAAVAGYTPQAGEPCPACHDHPDGRCLVCSASDQDPAPWPMMTAEERKRILLAGPPLRRRVAKAKARRETRREKRAAARAGRMARRREPAPVA